MTCALHGFLGSPHDWEMLDSQAYIPNLFDGVSIDPTKNMWDNAYQLNLYAAQNLKAPRTLLGFSMGGRLALHLLLDNPTLWDKAIIISAHPGLKTKEERQERLKNDRHWSSRFLHDPWDVLMNDWNKQSVFSNDKQPIRPESDFNRIYLAQIMTSFSLGLQSDLSAHLALLPMPIIWITGEKDEKFTQLAKGFSLQNPDSEKIVVPGAGHRILQDNPEIVLRSLEFIKF